MPHGNAYSRVDWTRQVRRSRSATKARANSIASTGDFFGQPPIRDIKALQDGKVAALRIERTLTASIS